MHETERPNALIPKTPLLRAALGVAVTLLLLTSCDDTKRHKMMSFFFDGVPPLPGDVSADLVLDPNEEGRTTRPARGWYVHEPLQDCTQCHGSRQKTLSRQVHLAAQPPALCYQCHEKEDSPQGWIHGPVAAGECLFCHEPHKTKTAFLLTQLPPDLCYQCHEPEQIRLIDRHAEESYATCLRCHEGHTGTSKSLLRPSFLDSAAGRSYRMQVQRQQYEQALALGRNELAQTADPLGVLRAAIGSAQACQPSAARGYLESLIEGNFLTDDEKRRVSEILLEAASWQASTTGGGTNDPNERDTLEAKCARLADALREIRDDRSAQVRETAELYYRSIDLYHAGRLKEAQQGFQRVLTNEQLPKAVEETVRFYLKEIEQSTDGVQPPAVQPAQ